MHLSFKRAYHLLSHEKIHTGEKPCRCDTCGRSFTGSRGLQSHQITCSRVAELKTMNNYLDGESF